MKIPLFLTPLGIKASHDLIKMINLLPEDKKSKFRGDNLLLDFFNLHSKPIMRYNMKSSLTRIIPIKSYNIPLLYQKVEDADCSGIYVFVHKTGNIGLGSALSCRDRLQDHMNSFYGNRPNTFLHRWILDNGGINSVKWAPIITYDNVMQEWYNYNFDSALSLGGTKILQGFGQYTVRLLEQSMYTQFKPFLSMYNEERHIIFFNFSFKDVDMKLDLNHLHTYQAWSNKERTNLIAESNSLNSLADMLDLSVGTVKNNMNWSKGLQILDKVTDKKTTIFLGEKGVPIRIKTIYSQLYPKILYPKVELINRTLYDLIPGRIHAIDVNTKEDFGNYANQRELWLTLNPKSSGEFNSLPTLAKQRNFLDSRIGRYLNVAKPDGISTELGRFYFCRHPDYLPNLTKTASGFFGVNLNTGVVVYFENNSQPLDDRLTVRRHRKNNTVSKRGFRYIDKDVFLKNFPEATVKKGSTYVLDKWQLENLPCNNN